MSLVREPALHFVLIGAALFGVHAWLAPPEEEPRRVAVSGELVEALKAQHEAETGAPPDAAALRARVDAWVDREVLYREALALGLDAGDPVVRRRLVQKLEFLAEDAPAAAPDDATLEAHLAQNAEAFREPPTLSFEHVFLRRGRGGEASDLLAALRGGADPATLGSPFVHGRRFERQPGPRVRQRFGNLFVEAVSEHAGDDWFGPVESLYGQHLVRVFERTPGRVPPLTEIRPAVAAHWDAQRRVDARAALVRRLRARYEVVRE